MKSIYLKGGDNGRAYNENKATLLSAFGSSYCTDTSSDFDCNVSGLELYTISDGLVNADDGANSHCRVSGYGDSLCEVRGVGVGGGGGE